MKTKIILLGLLSFFFIFGLSLTALVQDKTCQAVKLDKNITAQDLEAKQPKFLLGSIFYPFKNLAQRVQSFLARVKLTIQQSKENIFKKLSKTTGIKPSDNKPGTSTEAPSGTQPEYGPGDFDFTIKYQDRARFYSVHVPPCYNKGRAIPVIINLHGGDSTAEKAEEGIGGMNNKADKACFIGAYPNGVSSIGQPGKKQYWNGGTLVQIPEVDPSIDDVGFISKMLDELEEKFSIDTKKVYATGISNGAWMTYRLACELSDRIAAVAPIAGGLVLESCNPKRPVSIIHFHGTSDPGWPYYGGNGCWTDTYRPPIKDTIQKWIKLNMCANNPKVTYQKGEVACETYNCQEDSKITFCTIKGGGHTYPGGEVFQQLIPKWDDDCALGRGRGVGKTTQDIKALDAIWEFFQNSSINIHYPQNPSEPKEQLNIGYKIYDFSYQDSNGTNKTLTTAVWYPTNQAPQDYTYYTLKENLRAGDIKSQLAQNAPVAQGGPYPLFIFSHGATTCGTQSLFLTEYLASKGFIVVAPDYLDEVVICRIKGKASGRLLQIPKLLAKLKEENSTSEEVLAYFEDWFRFKGLSLAIDKMLAENRNSASIFYQKIDENKIAAGGHSAGAITTWGLIGANKNYEIDKRIKAALLLSGGPFPYYAEDFSRVNLPIMIMHGTDDEGINPQYPREIEYENSNAPKFYLVIKKSNHGAFANGQCAKYNSVVECQAGDSVVQVINKYSLAFLEWFIKGDENAKKQLEQSDNVLQDYQKQF